MSVRQIRHRDAFMWPYINQENLVKPHSLPIFMSAGARCHSSEFAIVDHETYRIGMFADAFDYKCLLDHRMDLTSTLR